MAYRASKRFKVPGRGVAAMMTGYRREAARKAVRRAAARARSTRRNIRTAGYLGIETKYLDTGASNLAIPAPADCSGGEMQPEFGCTNALSVPAQADGPQNRDGRKYVMKSMYVTGSVVSNVISDQADVTQQPIVFLALVLDTQANGATVVSEQVFTNPNDTADVNPHPLRNLEYSSRYRILATRTINMGQPIVGQDGAATSSAQLQPRAFRMGWRGHIPVTCTSGTTADVANVTDNAMHLIAFATNVSYVPQVSFNARLRFVG